jgi:hypothetical protein
MFPEPVSAPFTVARAMELRRDAALLRATTDLFVLDADHDIEDLRRYEELALHFLPRVAVSDRAYVAERISRSADAPHALVVALARESIDVAAPLIAHSPVLTAIDLIALIAAAGPEHRRAIAGRAVLPHDVLEALRLTGDAEVLGTLPPILSVEEPSPAFSPLENLDPWRFLGLGRKGRLAIFAALASQPSELSTRDNSSDLAFRGILNAARIVGFARSSQLPAIVAAICEGLSLPRDLVAAAISDPGGELLAVMLKALRLDDVQARQVFLLATPSGRDAAKFFPLSDVYSGLEVDVAETLVAAWRDTARGEWSARHRPHFAENGGVRRNAVAERRPAQLPRDQARRA